MNELKVKIWIRYWISSMNIFGLDLIVILNEKHSIRAILISSTNLTLCDSSLSIVLFSMCLAISLIICQNNIIMDYWNCETNEFFIYCLLVFLSFLSIHCFVFILPTSTILFIKFHSFVLLFIFFFFFCKNDVSSISTISLFFFLHFSSIIIKILLFIFLFLRILNFLLYFLNYSFT